MSRPLELGTVDMDQMSLADAVVFLHFFPENETLRAYMQEAWAHSLKRSGTSLEDYIQKAEQARGWPLCGPVLSHSL